MGAQMALLWRTLVGEQHRIHIYGIMDKLQIQYII